MEKFVIWSLAILAAILICANTFGDGENSLKTGIGNATRKAVTEMSE